MLEVRHISKSADGKPVLQDISFKQERGTAIAISGESGAGKTTLLKIIAGLLQPDSGQVLFNGNRVEGPLEKLIPGHPKIAWLSQHFELRNHYRMEELLEMSNKLDPGHAMNIYRICRIDHLMKRRSTQLSGGEKQRISLAALLSAAPELLLLDEPYSNLDPIHKNILKAVIDDVSQRLNINCILTSHDPFDTLPWADTIIVLRAGTVIQQATPHHIYHHPANEYVAGMFGKYVNASIAQINSLFGKKGKK